MKLRSRLLLAYSTVLLVAAIGLGLAVTAIYQLARVSDAIVEENIEAIDLSARLRTLISGQHIALTHRLLDGEGSMIELMVPFVEEASHLLREIRMLSRLEEERQAVDRAEQALAAVASLTLDLDLDPGNSSLERTRTRQLIDVFNELRVAATTAYESNFGQMTDRASRLARESRQVAVVLALVSLFTVLVGLLASMRLAWVLSAPMERFANAASQVAAGDYDIRLESAGVLEIDLMGRRFNEMTAALARFHAMRLDEIVAERRRLDTVVDGIDQGLVIIDERGRIERVNPVAARQLDCPVAAAPGLDVREILGATPIPGQVATLLEHPGAAPEASHGDFQRTVEGSQRTLAWSLTPFSDAQRRGLVLVLRDVSEERELERMRTEFVLRAAHELRTPITGIRMALGLIQDRVVAAEGSREAELLGTVNEEMERLVRLISNLLDLARLYNHSLELQVGTIDPQRLLKRAQERFAGPAAAAGVNLELEAGDGLPPEIDLDADQINRVLDNLLSNAIRHTPEGGTVSLGAARCGNQLEIHVTDTGEGIAPAQRSRVFEPFVQVGRSTGGAGMGLAMSREIVQQHRGRLQLEAAPGGGCRFVICLPL